MGHKETLKNVWNGLGTSTRSPTALLSEKTILLIEANCQERHTRLYSTSKITTTFPVASLTSATAIDKLSVILRSNGRVSPESGMRNHRCILQNVEYPEDSREEDTQKERQQLIQVVWRLEKNIIVELIVMTLDLPGTYQNLVRRAVYLPSVDVTLTLRYFTSSEAFSRLDRADAPDPSPSLQD